MQQKKQRTLERQYERAVRAFEEAQRQEIEATHQLNVARNSMNDLIRRSQNAMNAGNHPLAMTLEPQLIAAAFHKAALVERFQTSRAARKSVQPLGRLGLESARESAA